MADEATPSNSPFDVQTIRYLASLMSRHDLSEMDLKEGDARIRLRRGPRRVSVAGNSLQLPMPSVPAPAAPAAAAPAPAAEAAKPARNLVEIKSEVVGTYYAAANPGAEPFVKLGARVKPETVVGLIEAMKLFNEITANCSGVVTEVLVENQQPVEHGQVLFRVDPSA